jgi:hypothetical protein
MSLHNFSPVAFLRISRFAYSIPKLAEKVKEKQEKGGENLRLFGFCQSAFFSGRTNMKRNTFAAMWA